MSAVRRVRDHIDRLSAAPRTLSDLAAPGGSPTRTSPELELPLMPPGRRTRLGGQATLGAIGHRPSHRTWLASGHRNPA